MTDDVAVTAEQSAPIPKPPLWVVQGVRYRVRHLAFGEFTAECVDPHSGWAIFKLLDDTPQLIEAHYDVGQAIELSSQFTRVEAL